MDLADVPELTPDDFDGGPETISLVPPSSPPGFGDGVPLPPPIPPDEIVLEMEPATEEEAAS